MRRETLMVIGGCLAALILGLTLAYPLLSSQLPRTKTIGLGVDVVYAYIGGSNFDENIIGLWRNYSIPREIVNSNGNGFVYDVHAFSYLIILNITNNLNGLADIKNFDIKIGPKIYIPSFGGVASENPILRDSRQVQVYLPWNSIWSANASRLIYLSGVASAHDIAYNALKNGKIDIYAQVSGRGYSENVGLSGTFLKEMELQTFGDQYLYNGLLSGNQTLIFYDGLDVSVGTRQQP